MKKTFVQKFTFCAFFILFFSIVQTFAQDYTMSDHVAVLNELTGGKISAEDFKNATGLDLRSPDDGENCEVAEFNLVWVEKGKDPVEVILKSANFNEKALKLTAKAKSGTVYYFDTVKVKCAGKEELEKVNSLVFKIE